MKLLFTGWKRQVKPHHHSVTPVRQTASGNYAPSDKGQPITWTSPYQALGQVSKLALSGTFLVEFTFDMKDLRGWAEQLVQTDPIEAVRLFAELQAKALTVLATKPT
jgi:hypothetical protein